MKNYYIRSAYQVNAMKNLTLFPLLFCSALLFSTCHKGEGLFFKCKPENTIKIPPHAMDYFFFKVGTWWVYECEQSGARDSLFVYLGQIDVIKAEGAKEDCGCGWGKCFEFGATKIQSKYRDSLGLGSKIGYLFNHYDLGSFTINHLYGTTEIKEGYEGRTDLPGYKMNYEENKYYNPTGNGGILTEYDTMTVGGHLFSNVLEYSYLKSSGGGYPDWYKIAWYGKNTHLIRYIKTDGSIWNLVKWNIVQ